MDQLTTFPTPAFATRNPFDHRTEGVPMLIHEVLARSRQREAELEAREYRRARRLTAGRRWTRLATWAQRRARAELVRAGAA